MLNRLVLLLLLLYFQLHVVAQDRCVEFALKESSLGCANTIEPMCGCNQISYPNSCVAKKSGVVSYVAGYCNKVDSIKSGTVQFMHGAALPDTTSIALYLSFYNDSLSFTGVLPVSVCESSSLFYSIGTNKIVLFPNVASTCSDSCKKSIRFSVPIAKSPWYHIIFNGYIDTVFYKDKPVIKQDTVDFISGSCIANAKKQLAVNYSNESVTLSGVSQLNCCGSTQVIYSINQSVITLKQVALGECNCNCSYAFQCKIPTIGTGMYRIRGCGFDTVVTLSPKITSIEDFKISSDSLAVSKGGSVTLSVICNDIAGFTLRNDNPSVVDAKLFGKDIVIQGLQLGVAMLRIANKQGLEKVCKVIVLDTKTVISISDTALQLSLTLRNYKLGITSQSATSQVVWRSTDSKVATVDASGQVSLQSVGTCLIIASILNSSIADTCILRVYNSANTIFHINSYSKSAVTALDTTLTVGETRKLQIEWFDDVASRTLSYISQDTSVVKIDNLGTISAIAPGSALITVRYGAVASDSIRLRVVPQTTILYNRYNANSSTVSIGFLEKISIISDSLKYWTLVSDVDSFSQHPIALKMDNERDISLQFQQSPRSWDVYIEIASKNAICFANNSVLLPLRYKCSAGILTELKEHQSDVFQFTQDAIIVRDELLPVSISIISIDGRILKNDFISHSRIDISDLSAGHYILSINNSLQNHRISFTVSH